MVLCSLQEPRCPQSQQALRRQRLGLAWLVQQLQNGTLSSLNTAPTDCAFAYVLA
jgi:hypothetical protein